MMYRIGVLLSLMIFALCLTAWQQEPIPLYPGDEDRSHDGQPMHCQNMDTAKHAANCQCKSMNPDGESCDTESSKCKVYCRKTACRCISPCTT